VQRAFATLGPDTRVGLERDLVALVEEFNVSADSTMVVPAEYVEVVVVRRN
jgi:hypothetical protein